MAPLCSASPRPLEAPGQPRRRGAHPPRTVAKAAGARTSGAEARASLVLALASQALVTSQRRAAEAAKYAFPSRRFEPRTPEEALMSVPDLETVPFRVLKREADYEIREVESYFVAETMMPGRSGFDFNGSSQSLNVLASYLFGKNTTSEQMEMTTPVITRKGEPSSETMDMTIPVITKKSAGENKWKMSFVMPAKYGSNLPRPKDPSVFIKEVPSKIVAVAVFSGLVTDEYFTRGYPNCVNLFRKILNLAAPKSITVQEGLPRPYSTDTWKFGTLCDDMKESHVTVSELYVPWGARVTIMGEHFEEVNICQELGTLQSKSAGSVPGDRLQRSSSSVARPGPQQVGICLAPKCVFAGCWYL